MVCARDGGTSSIITSTSSVMLACSHGQNNHHTHHQQKSDWETGGGEGLGYVCDDVTVTATPLQTLRACYMEREKYTDRSQYS